MIAVDTNVLIHAHRLESEWNEPAHAGIERLWSGSTEWMIPWPCLHEFYCVVTHPKVHKPPSSISAACEQIEAWLASPSLVVGGEGHDYWSILGPLLSAGRIVGPMVYDAKIAAICLQARVQVLWTADRDFSRFPDLRCENPLVRRK